MRFFSRHGLEAVRRAHAVLLLVSFGLLIAGACCPASGSRSNGARRWVGAGPLQVQPSELMKLALVLYAPG